ncbi:MAG: sensor domain-containing protein [Nocardioidaceae bacterium]
MTNATRLRMTGYAAAQLLLAVPALGLFVLDVVAGTLVVVVVGVPVLLATLPAARWLANLHRRMAADVLGSPVPASYRPTGDAGPIGRLRVWAADPMTWRDQAWLVVSFVLACTMSLLVVLLFVLFVTGFVWYFGVGPIMVARSRLDRALLTYGATERLEQRVEVLTDTRAESLDDSAAELRRIERDLHDGAQARLVGLGMSLGMAADLLDGDPEGARKMLDDARRTTGAALGELRDVVHGIHPPVLADRGLRDAIEALSLDLPMQVTLTGRLARRLPPSIESAAYFAVAECLANIGKHSGAGHAWVELTAVSGVLRVVVGDDGCGGARPGDGTGMRGVARRLAAFDGTMSVTSPRGGPTLVTLEVPCASSSPKTSPSSGTA